MFVAAEQSLPFSLSPFLPFSPSIFKRFFNDEMNARRFFRVGCNCSVFADFFLENITAARHGFDDLLRFVAESVTHVLDAFHQ